MALPLGASLTYNFFFYKGGVLANPSVAPTATLFYPNNSHVSLSLTNPNTGEFVGTLNDGSDTLSGAYPAIAITTDTSMDNMISQAAWEVGTNDTASIWGYVLGGVASAGNILLSILAKLGVTPVQVSNPVNSLQTIVGPLIPGDDYMFADGQEIAFVSPYTGLTLVGGSVVYRGSRIGGGTVVVTGTIVDATHCYFELTKAVTNTLLQGTFSVEATLLSGHILTLAYGGQQVQVVQ